MTVFHGSPHKFDKFDMGKVGTGEGNQAYGHGLYFAENPKVAQEYAKLGQTGVTYKVDLPDQQVSKMLDWDKPLSQQPESVKRLVESRPEIKKKLDFMTSFLGKEPSGSAIYTALAGGPQLPSAAAASKTLRELGVPGVKYLDQGSRGSGSGTRNFVVFDDGVPKILGRE
jgi:hypothetical protein